MKGIFLDIEATGLDSVRHRPIDLALKVIDCSSGRVLGEYQALLLLSREEWEQSDPESLAINGYTWDTIQSGKSRGVVEKEVVALLTKLGITREGAFFVCQNPAFDRGFFSQIVPIYSQEALGWPYHWLDLASMYWTKYIETLHSKGVAMQGAVSLSKNSIAQRYGIPPEETPHCAMNGVDHLVACYSAVLELGWGSSLKKQ